jgi:hypothetical protein
MAYINNENRVRFLVESLKNDEKGYFLTVNALTKNREQFENQLLLLSLWLNDYCYGRRALKRDKRLTIFGGIEIGELSGKLHAHLIIKNDADIKRSIYEINFEVRKLWAKATKAKGNIINSLVDFQKTQNIKQSAEYALKKVRTNQNDTLLYI